MPAPGRAWPGTRCGRSGAQVVAVDLEFDMARTGPPPRRGRRRHRAAVPGGAFDVVVAAFVVNHLPDPVAGLTELRRVTRPGGTVLVSMFSVDAGRGQDGGRRGGGRTATSRPSWYGDLQEYANAIGDPASVERALAAAGSPVGPSPRSLSTWD